MTCELCAFTDPIKVRPGLACYADDGRFERMGRCVDHQECRDRVEASGAEWPLADMTLSSVTAPDRRLA